MNNSGNNIYILINCVVLCWKTPEVGQGRWKSGRKRQQQQTTVLTTSCELLLLTPLSCRATIIHSYLHIRSFQIEKDNCRLGMSHLDNTVKCGACSDNMKSVELFRISLHLLTSTSLRMTSTTLPMTMMKSKTFQGSPKYPCTKRRSTQAR